MSQLRTSVFPLLLLLSLAASSGGPSSAYSSLTSAERGLVLRYFWQVPKVFSAANFARDEAVARYPQLVGQDDQRDAFRHSVWNGAMTARLRSTRAAERWATAHEDVPGNPPVRQAMDLANNQTGRDTAWSMRTQGGPWWRRTRFPSDGELATRFQAEVDGGGLLMIEELNGQRDPHAGALVPTTTP